MSDEWTLTIRLTCDGEVVSGTLDWGQGEAYPVVLRDLRQTVVRSGSHEEYDLTKPSGLREFLDDQEPGKKRTVRYRLDLISEPGASDEEE